jgi:flagellar protein FlgJ
MQVAAVLDVAGPERQKVAKLAAGAHEFEGMMLQQMLKGLKFGGAPGDGEDEAGGAAGTMQSYGTEALAKSIASGGGFGIAKRIIEQVGAQAAHHNSGTGGKV